MNRRTFLRVLGGLAAATVVDPQLLLPTEQLTFYGHPLATEEYIPITYEMLERAYKACVVGTEHYLIAGPTALGAARRLGLIFDAEVDQQQGST